MNYGIKTAAIILSIAAVLGAGVAFAAGNPLSLINQQQSMLVLNAAYQYAGCKANFTETVLSDVVTDVPSLSNLTGQVTSVKTAYAELGTYASSGNVSGYTAYQKSIFDPSITSAAAALKSGFGSANLTSNEISTIRAQFSTQQTVLQNCYFGALKAYGNAKVSAYKQILAAADGVAANISAKVNSSHVPGGINVTPLYQAVQAANTTAVVPLQTAISQATNASQLKAAIQGYCLFDGCQNGVNAHLDAHYVTALFNIGINKLQTTPGIVYSTSNLTIVKDDVANASTALGQAGTSPFTAQQNQTIWNNLRSAADVAEGILSNIKIGVS